MLFYVCVLWLLPRRVIVFFRFPPLTFKTCVMCVICVAVVRVFSFFPHLPLTLCVHTVFIISQKRKRSLPPVAWQKIIFTWFFFRIMVCMSRRWLCRDADKLILPLGGFNFLKYNQINLLLLRREHNRAPYGKLKMKGGSIVNPIDPQRLRRRAVSIYGSRSIR